MKRKSNTPKMETKVLHSCNRYCAICFEYESDPSIKHGQIAHIDRNPNNNALSNLIFLCLRHHDEYDTRTSQSKGWTQEELKRSRESLLAFVEEKRKKTWHEVKTSEIVDENIESLIPKGVKYKIITADIYQLRIPIYNAYRELSGKILREAKIEYEDLFEFLNKTEEALFLYDEKVADYMTLIFKKGLRFHHIGKVLKIPDEAKREQLIDEESEILEWFANSFDQTRELFKHYLHLG